MINIQKEINDLAKRVLEEDGIRIQNINVQRYVHIAIPDDHSVVKSITVETVKGL